MAIAIILSGGTGTRMGQSKFPKQYLEVGDKPILMYATNSIAACDAIDEIIFVAHPDWHEKIAHWTSEEGITKPTYFAEPGETRQQSILNGLKAINDVVLLGDAASPDNARIADDAVIICDGVRPLVKTELVDRCIDALEDADAVMPVLEMKDTVYYSADGEEVSDLLKRDCLFAGQAPEAFRFSTYFDINCKASEDELRETRGSSEIAFKNGLRVKLIPGDESNFKITTQADLARFEEIVRDGDFALSQIARS